ncbi:GDSL-type esterase/lipase family protein [Galbitalea sp. SE-J8]|uniref:GAF domain-containing protein n=1 Tax=Galbitalea sp. SE-J8 TaxID=3054952 RepID=UPI00259CAA81|nr:GAF domain-containing protein [Galbitalea sp. SE-J8]MDM4763162.1 GDSL-type esterase/lipase family protein [Galbitalea sp. SE-J8]
MYRIAQPVLRLLLWRLNRAVDALPRPVDSPRAQAPGPDPDHVLLFGSGPVVGYGVLSHDLALPGQLARQLSAATGRGTDVDVAADTTIVIERALPALRELELWRYDAIVLCIGANNSLLFTPTAAWRRSMEQLLEHLDETVPTSTGIYVVAVPPLSSVNVSAGAMGRLAGAHADRLNAETRRLVARYPQVTFVPFSPLVKADFTRYRSASTYQQWASVIAAPLIRQLNASDPDREPERPDESSRLRALEASGIAGSGSEERFARIAVLANQLFGADQTLISFVDRDQLFVKASARPELVYSPVIPRAGSFADWAIRRSSVFVVEDALADPRFAQFESVTNAEVRLRFYAAYPIQSSFGERIGVVSVLAREPRTWTDSETSLLRDLALMVQRELD